MKLTGAHYDRAVGALLGSAAGDALGAGYEFTHPPQDTVIAMIGGGPFNFAPGEWTDDTSMAAAVARVAATGADLRSPAGLNAVAAGFSEWFAQGPKDVGTQTRAVLSHHDATAAEMTATAATLRGRKGGNGSLMRTAAVGLRYLQDPKGCLEAAALVSDLTHDDERARQACQIWSYAIRHAVLYGNFGGVRESLTHLGQEATDFWTPLLNGAETGVPQDFPKNGWVVHALQTAWYAITQADQSDAGHLGAALELAIRAGNDTDTTAAIAGGLLGARWGGSAVPARWRRMLHGWPGLVAKDLATLAIETVNGGKNPGVWPNVDVVDYATGTTASGPVMHPHDKGVFLAGHAAALSGDYDAVVSVCRMGTRTLAPDHVEFWLIDAGPTENENLQFILDDAAATVRELRAEGKTVLLHGVHGTSRTPSVAARYSMLLGQEPDEVLNVMTSSRPDPALWAAATHRPVRA
ncbi:O-acetyl-ADP-ribose deacetylase [Nakamurella antarctica]|uniref:O-acetyl-ADP-ribose deacetylase n=1 Tax=Nakamurella antarctica TaxID=1902245 RepID=A0A3G8ZMI7_9ACTN|nr:ADP-ribosylglycohydrolase family protein [Nakamurella antarctica]AZI58562.1 O-acetyl-ADP-ribose deacetylase [Nakamurella antarctica]